MKNFIFTIIMALILAACESKEKKTETNSETTSKAVEITVERGKVYEAKVTDSSSPVLTATQKTGQNIYTFAETPTYPIIVEGGWIDVDGDRVKTTLDTPLDIKLKSYLNIVTPITTYLASQEDETIREKRLEKLVSELNVSKEELLKLPSKADKKAILATNAIFQTMKEFGSTDLSDDFSEIKAKFSDLEDYLKTDPSKTTTKQIALFLEEKVVQDLVDNGSMRRFTEDELKEDSDEDTNVNESNISNTQGYLELHPIDDDIEDELADAILKVQASLGLITIMENKFDMSVDENWRLDFYNMVKSYQQANKALKELIEIHTQMETQYSKSSKLQRVSAFKNDCDPNEDPYCITNAQHKKIDIYLKHFGETTPGGKKIDIKTIAQRTQQSVEFIADILQDKYGKIAAKENREAAKWAKREYIAQKISDGADLVTFAYGTGVGIKVLKSGIQYGLKKQAISTILKSQLTKPKGMSSAVFNKIKSNYIKPLAKESTRLVIESKEKVLKGTWDVLSNSISMYDKISNLGYLPKSQTITDAKKVTDVAGLFLNVANIADTIKNPTGLSNIIIVSSKNGKKDILFFDNSLISELIVQKHGDLAGLSKFGVGIVYDKNGNIRTWITELTDETKEQIEKKLKEQTIEKLLPKGEYEYLDENNVTSTTQSDEEVDIPYVEKEYQKNEDDNSENEFECAQGYRPVCANNKTYANACFAAKDGYTDSVDGICDRSNFVNMKKSNYTLFEYDTSKPDITIPSCETVENTEEESNYCYVQEIDNSSKIEKYTEYYVKGDSKVVTLKYSAQKDDNGGFISQSKEIYEVIHNNQNNSLSSYLQTESYKNGLKERYEQYAGNFRYSNGTTGRLYNTHTLDPIANCQDCQREIIVHYKKFDDKMIRDFEVSRVKNHPRYGNYVEHIVHYKLTKETVCLDYEYEYLPDEEKGDSQKEFYYSPIVRGNKTYAVVNSGYRNYETKNLYESLGRSFSNYQIYNGSSLQYCLEGYKDSQNYYKVENSNLYCYNGTDDIKVCSAAIFNVAQ